MTRIATAVPESGSPVCPMCDDTGWTCEDHEQPVHHGRCPAPGMPCSCPIGQGLDDRLNEGREPRG